MAEKVFKEYKNISITGLSEQKEKYDASLYARSPYAHKISNLSWHITDHAFATIVGRQVEDKHKNYIQLDPIDVSSFNLPEKYAVITTGYTSKTREWLPEHVNGVTTYLLSLGITPVYLGKSYTRSYLNTGITGNFRANYNNGLNLIDKTDLFEAHAIMDGAICTLGLDNGLMHLNSLGKAPGIWGFTTVDPLHRLPYRNDKLGENCYTVVPTKEELKCIGCQSNMNFIDTDHSFTECAYGDFVCLTKMTADKWITQINKVVQNE